MSDLFQQAIDAALCCNWQEAIKINEEILKNTPKDLLTLNRLIYAYTQIGKISKAKKICQTVLQIDKYNFIAQKNLDKLKSLPKKFSAEKNDETTSPLSPNLFLEEPGKTKTIQLTHPAPKNIIYRLRIGMTVNLSPKKHSIDIRSEAKTYLGDLPDDIAFRLLRFLKAGNTYHACIKNICKNSLSIFIREISRGKKFRDQPTFMTTSSGHDYSSPLKIIKKSDKEDDDEKETQDAPEE